MFPPQISSSGFPLSNLLPGPVPRRVFSIAFTFYASYCLLRWIDRLFFTARSPFHSIPGPERASWATGNLLQLFNAKGLPFHQRIPDVYGGMAKVYGFFGDEQLYISDPHALQSILGKDQDSFEETAVFLEANKIVFGPGLVATTGELHKRQRKLAAPLFSSAQMAKIAPTFYYVANKMVRVLEKEVCGKGETNVEKHDGKPTAVLDMSEWVCRASLEAVGQAILGYSFDPLDSPVSNPYTDAIKGLIPAIFALSALRQFLPFLAKIGPARFRRWVVDWIPSKRIQKVKMSSDVMHDSAQTILKERREQLAKCDLNKIAEDERPRDIISVLLNANEKCAPEQRMSDEELKGQMTVLIFGAQDTTSSALSRILNLLATHPETQERVRAELRDAYLARSMSSSNIEPTGGCLDHATVAGLPWLDAVIKETLRLHPPVTFVRRTCVRETVVPYCPSQNGRSATSDVGDGMASVTVPKGTTVFLSILGFNRTESVWGADAKEWKPDRWVAADEFPVMQPYNSNIKIPGAFSGILSFLGGGRACIGTRFAMLEMKIILATILSKFSFSPTGDQIVWNLSQIISPSVRHIVANGEGGFNEEDIKGLPLNATLDDLTLNYKVRL